MSAPPVGLFVPCYVDQLWPRLARAACHLLERLGYSPRPLATACCGQAFANAGEEADAARFARAFAREAREHEVVLVLSASCAGHLARALDGVRAVEILTWLQERAPRRFPESVPRRLALHVSCAALRETRAAHAARDLLARVPALEVVEPEDPGECCGFGGTFSVQFPELSVKMGRDKLAALCAARDGLRPVGVVSTDCSCLLHLKAIADPYLPFHHVVEILREAVG